MCYQSCLEPGEKVRCLQGPQEREKLNSAAPVKKPCPCPCPCPRSLCANPWRGSTYETRSPSWPGVAQLSLMQTAASNHDSCEFRSIMRTPRPDVSALHYSRPLFCLLHSFRPLLQMVTETRRRCYRCPTHGGIQHSLSF